VKFALSLILINFFISTEAHSAQKAQVLIARGDVTKLVPGAEKAVVVKKGDWLLEDTSIVTKSRSFVKIRFVDRSTMNIGPKSMVVINKMPSKKANMVNLLTGIVKAEVRKKSSKKSKTKMFIKTRSAVMGVRGTKFQSTYNPANKITSLVTVEGNVAMVAKDPKIAEPLVEKVVIKKTAAKTIAKSITTPKPVISEVDKLETLMAESNDVVEVKAGRFSSVGENTKIAAKTGKAVSQVSKASIPVKIAPTQYNAIAKSMNSNKRAKDVMKTIKSDPVPEGFTDKVTGKVAPKAGGFVDFKTGLYIAPAAEAKLDKKTGTYKAKIIGSANKKTGDYIPPKGIKIDAKKGFVIDKKVIAKIASTADKEKLRKTLKGLNKDIKKQIVVNKTENKTKKSSGSKWLPRDHVLSAMILPYSESLTVKNKASGSEAEFFTREADFTILTWNQIWSDKWISRIRIGGHNYKIDNSDVEINSYDNGDDDDGYFSIGLGYNYTKKITFYTDMIDHKVVYLVPNGNGMGGNGSVNRRSQNINTLELSMIYNHGPWKMFDFKSRAAVNIGGGDAPTFNGEEESDFFGITLEGSAYYGWKKNLGIDTVLRYHRQSVENDDLEYTRNSLGLGFDFVWDI
jgi:hypothetical protein